ncbi:metallophosphoesterase family protein [Halobacillus naozhouensis]|uniref:Phosphoesterase n=1 Tax=Halobacillus naozhouensis TaxID=554880 RepID=A0ABY8IYH7_9BACI|nr:metallophosphoesterase [Halobacillus naozhouensis]WFT74851.1 metallophosphoesterase [Halobacillus naozhouensis]
MRVIVVSDTHMPKKAKELPKRLLEELHTADLIVHAGDWQSTHIYKQLSSYTRIMGVYGNVDDHEVREMVPRRIVTEWEGYKIGIVHGHGDKKTTETRVIEEFEGEELDLVIFGHSHLPLLKFVKKTMLFNPGSATDKRRLPYYSFGVITIDDHGLRADHIFYNHKET